MSEDDEKYDKSTLERQKREESARKSVILIQLVQKLAREMNRIKQLTGRRS
ncbi:MAG TPA: hypothetical protein VK612_10890 [Pyrinomonadaceae bacterium]|nr:hypothetical protein [Pyrinomonadaceae bacterium]